MAGNKTKLAMELSQMLKMTVGEVQASLTELPMGSAGMVRAGCRPVVQRREARLQACLPLSLPPG